MVLSQPGTGLPPEAAWQRPSARMARMRRAEVWSVAIPLAVAGGALLAGFWSVTGGTLLGVGLLAAGALADRFLRRRWASWGYLERGDDLLVRRGVMVRRLSVVPYGRMQLVDVSAGPVERVFGLATLKLHTAAAATDARVPGLEAEEAARLRDHLAALGEARATGL
ncbi:MAG: PH domain-containing protein [Acidimicrobiales bacterium]